MRILRNISFCSVYRSAKRKNNSQKNITLNVHFFRLLESRLDALLLRSNIFSMPSIRQLIRHGYVMVNKKICYNLGKRVYPGDIITLVKHPLLRKLKSRLRRARIKGKRRRILKVARRFSPAFGSYIACPYLLMDLKSMRIFVIDWPVNKYEVYFPFDLNISRALVMYQAVK
jgi:ribosomal protein S4